MTPRACAYKPVTSNDQRFQQESYKRRPATSARRDVVTLLKVSSYNVLSVLISVPQSTDF